MAGADHQTTDSTATDCVPCAADILSVRQIKRLQHLWCHFADAGQWNAMADLFTEEGVWTDGAQTINGRPALSAFFAKQGGGVLATRRGGLTYV